MFTVKNSMRLSLKISKRSRIVVAMVLATSAVVAVSIWVQANRPTPRWCQQGHPLLSSETSYVNQDVVHRVETSRLSKPLRQLYDDSRSGTATGRNASDYAEALAFADTVQPDRFFTNDSRIYTFLSLPFTLPFADRLSHTPKLEVYVCNKCRAIVYTEIGDNRF